MAGSFGARMSIATYSELQTAVANWLHRSDLTSIIPDLIMLGENRIFRELRCRDMESALSVTFTSGVAAVPSDYLELKFAYLDGTPVSPLKRSSASAIYTRYPLRSPSGKPSEIAREGSNFIFGPYPDGTYTLKGIYYAEPTSVTTSDTFLAIHPDLFLFAALSESAPYIKEDARITLWEGKYQNILNQLNIQDAGEESSGGGMTVRAA